MEFLKWLQEQRTPFMDGFFSAITHLGEETIFIVLGILFFWCISKREGYFLLATGLIGTVLNQFLKLWYRIPRPWVLDETFEIVESARAEATGYSFPSGHTQMAAGLYGGIARWHRGWVRVVGIVLALLIAFSRLYLGVHTPADVGVSLVVAVVLIFVLYPLMESTLWFPNRMYVIIGGMLAFSLAFVGFMELYPFPADVDAANFASAVKNAYTMAGSVAAMLVVYILDSGVIKFSTRAPWWGQLIKVVGGLALAVAVKSLLKAPLLALCGGHDIANALRYFLMVITAGCLWPMTFRIYARFDR